MSFLSSISTSAKDALKHVDACNTKDRSNANTEQLPDELETENEHWDSFFNSSCNVWLDHIKDMTFTSTFCDLSPREAKQIVNYSAEKKRLKVQLLLETESGETIADQIENLHNATLNELKLLVERLEFAIEQEVSLYSFITYYLFLHTYE